MNFLSIFLLILFVINCVFLVLIILPQNDSSSAGAFGPASTQFGSRSGNVLTRTTTILGISFLVLAFGLAYVNRSAGYKSDIIKAEKELNGVKEPYKWWEKEAPGTQSQENANSQVEQSTSSQENANSQVEQSTSSQENANSQVEQSKVTTPQAEAPSSPAANQR